MSSRHPAFESAPLVLLLAASAIVVSFRGCEVAAQDPQDIKIVNADWELVSYDGHGELRRTRIPSGWLLLVEGANGPTPVIIPDREHEWLNVEVEAQKHDAYVTADRVTFDAIVPYLNNHKRYVLNGNEKQSLQKLIDSWRARIEAAEGK